MQSMPYDLHVIKFQAGVKKIPSPAYTPKHMENRSHPAPARSHTGYGTGNGTPG